MRSRAFTLVEVVVSIVIVGVMLTAALNTLGAVQLGMTRVADREHGLLLAHELMGEILQQRYREADGVTALGRDAGETTLTRATWDDVDDYHAMSESPPRRRSGAPVADGADWSWRAAVQYVASGSHPWAPSKAGVDTGMKQITVTVSHHGVTAATLVAIRTDGWETPP